MGPQSNMTGVLIRGERPTGTTPGDDRGRAQSDAAEVQGLTAITESQEEARKVSTQSLRQHGSDDPLISIL